MDKSINNDYNGIKVINIIDFLLGDYKKYVRNILILHIFCDTKQLNEFNLVLFWVSLR